MSLDLTVPGTASPHPQPGRPCSGYLLRGGGAEVWVDAGPGSFAELQRHADPARLGAIWVSHLHADHCADLLSAVYGLTYGGLTPAAPLPVYAPRDCGQRLAGFFGRRDPGFLDGVFDFRSLEDGHEAQVGGVRLHSRAVVHDTEAYGLRAVYGGSVLAYSGDSGPCSALAVLPGQAQAATVVVSNSTDLTSAIKNATVGTVIQVRGGTYYPTARATATASNSAATA